jgi:hypothetical protein
MSTASYSSNGSRPTSRHHDTGFPDFFASCTTSLRHPDAVVDPGFAISAEHIDPAKTLQRSRKSLLRKHRRTISHGKINEDSFARDYTERPSLGVSATEGTDEISHNIAADVAHSSNAGGEPLSRTEEHEHDHILGLSTVFQHVTDDGDDGDERRRDKILRKLMHKN